MHAISTVSFNCNYIYQYLLDHTFDIKKIGTEILKNSLLSFNFNFIFNVFMLCLVCFLFTRGKYSHLKAQKLTSLMLAPLN